MTRQIKTSLGYKTPVEWDDLNEFRTQGHKLCFTCLRQINQNRAFLKKVIATTDIDLYAERLAIWPSWAHAS